MSAAADEMLSGLVYDDFKPFVPDIGVAKCIRVVDGDTIVIGTTIAGYGPTRFICKLLGIVAPDLRARQRCEKTLAKIARDSLRDMLVSTLVSVHVAGVDKYGRLLVRVSAEGAGGDVSQKMLRERLVRSASAGGTATEEAWSDLLRAHMGESSGGV